MSVELFLKLKEIDSLTKMKHNLELASDEEKTRLVKLQTRKEESQVLCHNLQHELLKLHDQMAETDKKIQIAGHQKQSLMDIGGDEAKIQKFAQDIELLENSGLELLSQTDDIENKMQDTKTFLSGLENTIQEIQSEVDEKLSKNQKEIEMLDFRISGVTQELPEDFQRTLKKVSEKKLKHGPFTRVDQGSCFMCRYKLSRIEESEIDMQKGLKTCRQCSRIFIPYGA